MADELAQFSFLLLSQSRAIAATVLSHVGNVMATGSLHLRMRIATVHMVNAATVQGRPLLRSARVLCGGAYSRAAFIRGAAFIQGNAVYISISVSYAYTSCPKSSTVMK